MLERRTRERLPGDMNLSDEVLVARALSNPAGFEVLFNRYWDPVYRYCLYRLAQVEDAEDAGSRIFLNTYAGLPRYSARLGTFRTWLFCIAHNEVANWHRDRSRHPAERLDLAETLLDPGPSPEEHVILASEIAEARRFLGALPEHYQRVIELRLAGLRDTEIATVLETTHGAVRKAQSRAMAQLRSDMGVTHSRPEVPGE